MTSNQKILVTVCSLVLIGGAGYLIYTQVQKGKKKESQPDVAPAVDPAKTEPAKTEPTKAVVSAPASKPTAKPSGPYKIFAKNRGTNVWTNVNDIVPYRMAGDSELLGTTMLKQVKSYAGNSFYEITQPDKTVKYVSVFNTKFTA